MRTADTSLIEPFGVSDTLFNAQHFFKFRNVALKSLKCLIVSLEGAPATTLRSNESLHSSFLEGNILNFEAVFLKEAKTFDARKSWKDSYLSVRNRWRSKMQIFCLARRAEFLKGNRNMRSQSVVSASLLPVPAKTKKVCKIIRDSFELNSKPSQPNATALDSATVPYS